MEARIKLQTERPVKYRPFQVCFNQEASEARVESLRQARHALKLQDQAQGNHSPVDIATPSCRIHLGGHMLPSLPLPAFGRQVTLHQLPDVRERLQRHD